jgi:hypothetical protein
MNEIYQLREELIRLDQKLDRFKRTHLVSPQDDPMTDADWVRLENVLEILYILDPNAEEEMVHRLKENWFDQYERYLFLRRQGWK